MFSFSHYVHYLKLVLFGFRPLLVSITQLCVCLRVKATGRKFQKGFMKTKKEKEKKRKLTGSLHLWRHFQIRQTTLSVTKHTYSTEDRKKQRKKTSLDLHLAADSFGRPDEIGSVSLSIHKHKYTFIHTLADTYCKHTHIHTAHT